MVTDRDIVSLHGGAFLSFKISSQVQCLLRKYDYDMLMFLCCCVLLQQHLLQLKVPGMEVTAVSRDEDQKVTVIHRAAEAGQLDCLRFLMGTLLSCDASPQDATTLVDIADRTPAMLALQVG